MNRRSSSGQLTIASTQIASFQTANLDFITSVEAGSIQMSTHSEV